MKTYKEAQDHQLSEWVAGRPWHNPFNHDNTRHDGDTRQGECCPDFSCCVPEMLATEAARKAFAKAGIDTRMEMLGMFLGGAVQAETNNDKIYIAGLTPPTEAT